MFCLMTQLSDYFHVQRYPYVMQYSKYAADVIMLGQKVIHISIRVARVSITNVHKKLCLTKILVERLSTVIYYSYLLPAFL